MPEPPQISFGDNVRVRRTPETEASGLAGLVGQVWGGTRPSVTGVKVMGELTRDCAVSVHFEERGETVWLAEQLIEFVDHAPGTTVRGPGEQWVRDATGEWIQIPTPQEAASSVERDNRRVKIIVGVVVAIFVIIILFSIMKRL